MSRNAPRVAVGVVLAVAMGCATIRQALSFQEPQIELKEIDITGLSLTGGTLDLVFDVYNPNDYRLRSTRLEVSLDLEGTHFGEALIDKPLDLSPENHSRVVMPVRFEWAGVGAGMRALLERGAIRYVLGGAVLLDTPLGERRVGLKGDGEVPLKKLLR
ncbi:MAG TPA: LEA type 2 family protein [Gemmatimonadales bacterium]|nr:LEA type 2 family protein [Gemmatimonadales bacterium]